MSVTMRRIIGAGSGASANPVAPCRSETRRGFQFPHVMICVAKQRFRYYRDIPSQAQQDVKDSCTSALSCLDVVMTSEVLLELF